MFIAKCPKCHESITAEMGVAPETEVSCPLCQANFQFGAIIQALPPRLIVHSTPVLIPASAPLPVSGWNEVEIEPEAPQKQPSWMDTSEPPPMAEYLPSIATDAARLSPEPLIEEADESGLESQPLFQTTPVFPTSPAPPLLDDIMNTTEEPELESYAPDHATEETEFLSQPIMDEVATEELGAEPADDAPMIETKPKSFGYDEAEAPAFIPSNKTLAFPKSKKAGNPIFGFVGIVLAGLLAFPLSALILWWLPGGWSRDLLDSGKIVSEYAPFLVPAKYHGKPNGLAKSTNPVLAEAKQEGSGEPKTQHKEAPKENGKKTRPLPEFENKFDSQGQAIPPGGNGAESKNTGETVEKNPATADPGVKDPTEVVDPKKPANPFDSDTAVDPTKAVDPATRVDPVGPDVGDNKKTDPMPGLDPLDPTFKIPDPGSNDPPLSPPDKKPDGEEKPSVDPAASDRPIKARDPDQQPGEEKPAADPKEPAAPAAEKHPVSDAPHFAAAEITTALDKASRAEKAWDSLPADAAREEKQKTAIEYRDALAQLAQTSTFGDKTELTSELDENIRGRLATLAGDASKVNLIAASAASTLRSAKGAPMGVMLAGEVKESRKAGEIYEVTISLLNKDKTSVSVLTASDPSKSFPNNAKVLVLGSIIDQPATHVRGYSGEAQQGVWAGIVQIIPAESRP